MEIQPADAVEQICNVLATAGATTAARVAREVYPNPLRRVARRRYTPLQCLKVFVRDGFVDRYSGERLVFPGVLRVLSEALPDEFPRHRNWKFDKTHISYWELFPTIDHVVPVTRGGVDAESNWVTTSMLRNSAKAHWTLAELGWSLMEPGSTANWDGLSSWFVQFARREPQFRDDPYISRWLGACDALDVRGEHG